MRMFPFIGNQIIVALNQANACFLWSLWYPTVSVVLARRRPCFADVAHQLCQLHYPREVTSPFWETDHHAKKELRILMREVRPLECTTVRTSITEDAHPPLVFAGLNRPRFCRGSIVV